MSSKNIADDLDFGRDDDNSFDFGFDQLPEISKGGIIELLELDCLISAPKEWNFYKPLSDNKFTELVESIDRNGLLNPLIVWEMDNNEYMILSGHNRKKAYEVLREMNGNNEYDKISALIKYKNDITDDEAREIIIDTNWVQRVLSASEKAKSVIEKYAVLQKKLKYGEGKTRDTLGREYKITGRQIDNYRRLENTIEEIYEMVLQETIPLTPACEMGKIGKDMQRWVYENHKDKFKSSYTRQLTTDMTLEEVINVFEGSDIRTKEETGFVKFKLPVKFCTAYKSFSKEKKLIIENEVLNLLNKHL